MPDFAHGNFSRKRLVIFGCGYIGGEVAREALVRGMEVTALTRNRETADTLRAQGVDVVIADLATDDWHPHIASAPDYVLNAVSSGGGGVEGYRRSYLEGMRSILRWAVARRGVGTLVYTSSTSVYPQDDGVVVDETAPTDAVGERARILTATEALLIESSRAEIRRYFILRLAGIYGPRRHHLLEQVQSGSVAGRGHHHLNLAHRDDVCAAIWSTFGAEATVANDIFNVADDTPERKEVVVAWLAERLNVPAPLFTGAPAGGRRAVTPDRIISNTKLKAALGWRPRFPSYREGYENMLSRAPE